MSKIGKNWETEIWKQNAGGNEALKIQAQKEIKFTDTTGKGTRLRLIVRLLDSYQSGKKGIEERRHITARQ